MSRAIKPPPPSLKHLDRFLKTANQVEKYEPLVAYCCRQYAVEQGISLRGKGADAETKSFLLSLMDHLESEKPKIEALGISSKEEYMKSFSLKVFKIADDEDRAGRANKNTARNFLHASIFFDVLRQFSELTPELTDMQRYAKWKATDIAQALRDGRNPVPGGAEVNVGDQLQSTATLSPSATPIIQSSPSLSDVQAAEVLPTQIESLDQLLPLPPKQVVQRTPISNPQAADSFHSLDAPQSGPADASSSHFLRQTDFGDKNPAETTPRVIQQTPVDPHSATPTSSYPSAPTSRPTHQATNSPATSPSYSTPPPYPANLPASTAMTPAQAYPVAAQPYMQPYVAAGSGLNQHPPAGHAPTEHQLLDAQKFTKYALSALQFDDVPTAIKNLRHALSNLTGQPQ